ncbi:hypothetical protein [Saccharomonospora viridis]|jgi:hypothetical protein|uniref:hypothetical protein n=1 Tax=Saccharomonospora viridis TaxID=1852 RepID=UPI000564522E|nr:hypothetical protein [Saccharomonospora viridis]SFP19028.1 hypothetical protein SAMN02982918_1584 [Saccharomonospora viridis]
MPTYEEPAVRGQQSGNWLDAVSAMAASVTTGSGSSMTSEAKKMLASAKSGGFMVSEEAAKPIRDVLLSFLEEVEKMSERLKGLAQKEPALGGHDYGREVADFQRRATAVDPDSPAIVLDRLRDVLIDADKALEIAMNKYRESEESAASSMISGQV